MAAPEKKKTSMGMEENVESGLCYVGSFVTGIIFLASEKESKLVRFHAIQSIAFAVVFAAAWLGIIILAGIFRLAQVWAIVTFFDVLGWLTWIAYIVVSVIVLIRAFTGSKMKLPVIGDYSEKKA